MYLGCVSSETKVFRVTGAPGLKMRLKDRFTISTSAHCCLTDSCRRQRPSVASSLVSDVTNANPSRHVASRHITHRWPPLPAASAAAAACCGLDLHAPSKPHLPRSCRSQVNTFTLISSPSRASFLSRARSSYLVAVHYHDARLSGPRTTTCSHWHL